MMKTSVIAELIRSAIDGLWSHKLRSGLTTLGVIFGVAAVISMSSIGEGARREALQQIEMMGASNIIIDEARSEDKEEAAKAIAKNPKGLNLEDAKSLELILDDILRVVPERSGEANFTANGKKVRLNSVATTPDMFDLFDLSLSEGRRLSWQDDIDARRVCVLGSGAKRELFPLESAIDKDVRVGLHVLTVVGVIESQSVGGEIEGFSIQNRNLDVYVPLNSSLMRQPPQGVESELTRITVQIADVDQMTNYSGVIRRVMLRRHNGVQDFSITVPEELLRQHTETQRIFNIVMGTIASISLLVGGIGIMNIMLASVLERTKEIGLRRALGARQADIARQFLAEAVVLSVSGGIIGVIVGIVLAQIISIYAEWDTAVSMWSIFIAVGVSVAVGVIFGYLPARRAAKLDPISALRFE